jgi:phasin family protein
MQNTKSQPQSVVNANKLFVANLEKLVNFQMGILQSYKDMWLNQLKAAAEITDAQGLQQFYGRQTEVASTLRQKMMDDAKALADLGTSFKADFDKLAKDSVVEPTKLAKDSVVEPTPKAV